MQEGRIITVSLFKTILIGSNNPSVAGNISVCISDMKNEGFSYCLPVARLG